MSLIRSTRRPAPYGAPGSGHGDPVIGPMLQSMTPKLPVYADAGDVRPATRPMPSRPSGKPNRFLPVQAPSAAGDAGMSGDGTRAPLPLTISDRMGSRSSPAFLASLARQRAGRAAGAAAYAEAGAIPTDPAAAAGRKAYIARQKMALEDAQHDLTGDPNFGLNRQLATSADARANAESAADVELTNADARFAVPATAEFNRARARGVHVDADTNEAVRPHLVGAAAAEVDRFSRLTPAVVAGTERGMEDAAAQIDSLRGTVRDLSTAAKTMGAGKAAPAAKQMNARDMAGMYSLLSEERGKDFADAWLDEQLGNGEQQDPAPAPEPAPPANPGLPASIDTRPYARSAPAMMPLLPAFGGANAGYAAAVTPAAGAPLVTSTPGPTHATPQATAASLPRVNTPDEARRLPRGTRFIGPDGTVRQVP